MMDELGIKLQLSEVTLNSLGMYKPIIGYFCKPKLMFPRSDVVDCPFFAIPEFQIKTSVPSIDKVISKLESYLSPSMPKYEDGKISVHGIIGCDLISHFRVLEFCDFMGGSCLRLSNGIIPVGVLEKFNLSFSKNSKLKKSVAVSSVSIPFVNKFDPLKEEPLGSTNSKGVPLLSKTGTGRRRCNCKYRNKKERKGWAVESNNRNRIANYVFHPKPSHLDALDFVNSDEVLSMERGLDKLLSLESIGICEKNSNVDLEIIKEFQNNITFNKEKFHVELPWDSKVLKRVPSNFELSKSLAKRGFDKNKQLGIHKEYNKIFNEQVELGIIEEIYPKDFQKHKWIPHRAVVKQDPLVKTTKIRAVYNCSLRVKGLPSINDAAFPGVDCLNPLLGLLTYFRTNSYVFLADIRKAFLNIFLSKESDKNIFSFVVFNGNKFRYFRFNTILFGFVASPFILNFVLKFFASKIQSMGIRDMISNKFYVDNLIFTSNSKNEVISSQKEICSVMEQAGFKLQELITNDTKISEGSDCAMEDCKVLGYHYSPLKDLLSFRNISLDLNSSTKREIVSQISSLFDPLGIITPITINLKFFIRKLHLGKYSWDETLPNELLSEYKSLGKQVNSCRSLCFPRMAFSSQKIKLSVFCDASKEAYSCAVFAVEKGKSSLVFSKVKLAPFPSKTLPSLELLAVYLGFQCVKTIITDVNFKVEVEELCFLSDSQVALSWLLAGRAQKKNVFVNNRLRDIQEMKEIFEKSRVPIKYSYVPSEHNVGDLITRKTNISNFVKNFDSWLMGPGWLTLNSSLWPKGNPGCLPSPRMDSEWPRISEQGVLVGQINRIEPLIQGNRFSDFNKLHKALYFVFKFINIKCRWGKDPSDLKERAFLYIIKLIQRACFPEEWEYLNKKNPNIEEKPKRVSTLNLFLDDKSIIRSRARLENAIDVSYEFNNPILLGRHHITDLVIQRAHRETNHLGIETTITRLRSSGFLILKGRSLVKFVLGKCITCNRFNARSGASGVLPPLPPFRTKLQKPFHCTGIDYTGAFNILEVSNRSKVYILIFTCMVTRAVHLELVRSMETSDFILAFLRFCNRYGIPKEVYSDNAKTFIAGASLLSEIFLSNSFSNSFFSHNIKFKTIPTYSPWYGACWERLIRVVKSCLYKTLGRRIVNFDCLLTLLSDIQNSINARPLFYTSTSDLEFVPISPNNFLGVNPSINNSFLLEEMNIDVIDPEEMKETLTDNLNYREVALNRFNREWLEAYLGSLNSFSQSNQKLANTRFKIGRIVLIKVPGKPRNLWSLGRIIEVLPDKYGNIRVVKLVKGDKQEYTTSVENVCPLELEISNEGDNENGDLETEEAPTFNPSSASSSDGDTEPARPLRRTANKQRALIRELIDQGDL